MFQDLSCIICCSNYSLVIAWPRYKPLINSVFDSEEKEYHPFGWFRDIKGLIFSPRYCQRINAQFTFFLSMCILDLDVSSEIPLCPWPFKALESIFTQFQNGREYKRISQDEGLLSFIGSHSLLFELCDDPFWRFVFSSYQVKSDDLFILFPSSILILVPIQSMSIG
jgi:hypothetical protein